MSLIHRPMIGLTVIPRTYLRGAPNGRPVSTTVGFWQNWDLWRHHRHAVGSATTNAGALN